MAEHIEESRAPLIDHLVELRNRLKYSAIALIVAFIACYFVAEDIFEFLVQPLKTILERQGGDWTLIYTHLLEAFFVQLKIAFWTSLFVAFPVIANQMWMFVAPGLYKHEKKAFLPFLIVTPILFFAGGALVYYFIFPQAWKFFVSFESTPDAGGLPIELLPKMGEYLSLVMKLIFAFGISFQLPVLMTLLARAGMATSAGLRRKRKYAIIVVFIMAAILTPPDVISQLGLGLPLLLLYEVSILLVRAVERRRAQREAAEAAEFADLDEEEESPDETDFNLDR